MVNQSYTGTPLSIAIVEDEPALRNDMADYLLLRGHHPRAYDSAESFEAARATQAFDLLILDLGLPGEDGLFLLNRLRRDSAMGVIIVSARGQIEDRLDSYRLGADMVLVKPVDYRELDALVNSLARRITSRAPRNEVDWRLELGTGRLQCPTGSKVALGRPETLFLSALARTPGKALPHADLIVAMEQDPARYSRRQLGVFVFRLKEKIRKGGGATVPLESVYGTGYMLTRACAISE